MTPLGFDGLSEPIWVSVAPYNSHTYFLTPLTLTAVLSYTAGVTVGVML